MGFQVFYDENSAYQDPEARSGGTHYATAEEAIAACQKMVDSDLDEMMKPGMGGGGVLTWWKMFGRDPFIVATDGSASVTFSAWSYAEARSKTL